MPYTFPGRDAFLDRVPQLRALEEWWANDDDLPVLILHGRRRAGKSWLFRRFADGKDAHIFVCDRRAPESQLSKLADELQPLTGVVPRLRSMSDFYRAIFRSDGARRLIVIDEFPELFSPGRHPDAELATVLEDVQGRSQVKLIVCGSHVGAMERLLASRAPLHGRARELRLDAFPFAEACEFLSAHRDSDAIERYAIAGGMPRYLRLLARHVGLGRLVRDLLLDQNGALFNEPRTVLEMELADTAVYFTLLETLARHKEVAWGDLVNESGVPSGTASKYIRTLEDLSIVEAATPMFAPRNARRTRYRLRDHLMRFWFRFVFAYQDALTADLLPEDHYRRNVEPYLAEHVSPVFEDVCRSWLHRRLAADRVGAWWGPARHDLRRAGARTSEEIDLVAVRGRTVTAVGECKWQARPMPLSVLDELRDYKIPALAQAGADIRGSDVYLFSRGGFAPDLVAAAKRSAIHLTSLADLFA